jgi:ubiquinone biosynthesis protein COQ4
MLLDPIGRQILRKKPLIDSTLLQTSVFQNLHESSFGKHYIDFLQTHSLNPDARPKIKYITDPELAYVLLRYRHII